ncbi:MAG: PD40 domain-containing protein [Deltaproteobacteria bacterium]|nr:PD40 domain-containing protein [Deltaproteobacteria bacterium]
MRSPSLYLSAAGITLLLGAAKVLGFVEKQFLAFRFGASVDVDAFLIAFGLMMVIFDLARAVVGPALLPLLTRAAASHGEGAAWRAAGRVAGVMALVMAAVSAALALGAPPLVRHVLAPGLDSAAQHHVAVLARWVLPALVPLGAALVTYTVFHALGRFFAPALGELTFKLAGTIALVVVWIDRTAGLEVLAAGYLVGGVAMLALHLVALGPARRALVDRQVAPAPLGSDTWSAAWPIGIAAAAIGLRQVLEASYATHFGGGSVSLVAYAWKLVDLPTVIAAEPLAVVFFASFARSVASRDEAGARAALASALRSSVLVAVPLAVGLAALAAPTVALLFQWGSFDAGAADVAVRLLRTYTPAMPLVFVDLLLTRYAIAHGEVRPTVRAELVATALNMLAWPALGRFLGIAALPAAFALGRAVKVTLLAARLRGSLTAGEVRNGVSFVARIAVAVTVARLVLGATATAFADGTPDEGLVERMLALALPGAAFVAGYGALTALLGIAEMRALGAWLRRAARPGLAALLVPFATTTVGAAGAAEIEWNPDAVTLLPGPIAFQAEHDGNTDIYFFDPSTSATRRLTDDPAVDRYPAFAADGKTVYFVSNRGGVAGIHRVALATGVTEPVVVGPERAEDPAPTPDGKSLLFTRSPGRLGWNLVSLDLASGAERPLTHATVARYAHPSVSADGARVAFTRNEGRGWQVGTLEVATPDHVRDVTSDPGACRPDASGPDGAIAFVTQRWDGKGDIAVTSRRGGAARRITATTSYDYFPAWSRDGRWIAFASTTAKDKGPGGRGPWHLALAAADGSRTLWLTRSSGSELEPTFAP